MEDAQNFAKQATKLLSISKGMDFAHQLIMLCNRFKAVDISFPNGNACWKVKGVEVHYTYNEKFHVPCSL